MIHTPPPDLWTLDAFVSAVNAALPEVLPDAPLVRIERTVTPRLVRYLATQGVVSEPHRAGREARYDRRHLLELLAVRRLMALGHTVAAVGTAVRSASDADVEAMLSGEVGLSATPTDAPAQIGPAPRSGRSEPAVAASQSPPGREALDFLASLGEPEAVYRSPVGARRTAPRPPGFKPSRRPGEGGEVWRRAELAPGVELHVSDDAVLPVSARDHDHLRRALLDVLDRLAHDRRRSR